VFVFGFVAAFATAGIAFAGRLLRLLRRIFQRQRLHRGEIRFFEPGSPPEHPDEEEEENADGDDSKHAYATNSTNNIFDHMSISSG
jgi:hypothetical protein